jgi:hypothetical protein
LILNYSENIRRIQDFRNHLDKIRCVQGCLKMIHNHKLINHQLTMDENSFTGTCIVDSYFHKVSIYHNRDQPWDSLSDYHLLKLLSSRYSFCKKLHLICFNCNCFMRKIFDSKGNLMRQLIILESEKCRISYQDLKMIRNNIMNMLMFFDWLDYDI